MNDIQGPEKKIEADGNQRVIAPDQKGIDRLLENLGHIRSQNADRFTFSRWLAASRSIVMTKS
jgi:hypothetical protein